MLERTILTVDYTWPNGQRHAIHQSEHEAWNAKHYPGTRQLCTECDEPTGRCEEDALYAGQENSIGPLCEKCFDEAISLNHS